MALLARVRLPGTGFCDLRSANLARRYSAARQAGIGLEGATDAPLLIEGAASIARSLGVPELTIGLALVAVGTSLPELFTALVAAIKREPDIALGNVVGSNVLNILVVLGGSALVRPVPVSAVDGVVLDVTVMLTLSLLLLPFLLTGLRLGRREGTLLLIAYAAYRLRCLSAAHVWDFRLTALGDERKDCGSTTLSTAPFPVIHCRVFIGRAIYWRAGLNSIPNVLRRNKCR